jgi:hypothetical protein
VNGWQLGKIAKFLQVALQVAHGELWKLNSDMGKWREDGELVRGSGESDPRGERKGKKSVPHLQLEFERKKGEMLFLG